MATVCLWLGQPGSCSCSLSLHLRLGQLASCSSLPPYRVTAALWTFIFQQKRVHLTGAAQQLYQLCRVPALRYFLLQEQETFLLPLILQLLYYDFFRNCVSGDVAVLQLFVNGEYLSEDALCAGGCRLPAQTPDTVAHLLVSLAEIRAVDVGLKMKKIKQAKLSPEFRSFLGPLSKCFRYCNCSIVKKKRKKRGWFWKKP